MKKMKKNASEDFDLREYCEQKVQKGFKSVNERYDILMEKMLEVVKEQGSHASRIGAIEDDHKEARDVQVHLSKELKRVEIKSAAWWKVFTVTSTLIGALGAYILKDVLERLF